MSLRTGTGDSVEFQLETDMTPIEALQMAKDNGARQVDIRFADIPGLQHLISYPIGELNEGSFTDGFGIDGSSIRGWAAINESDIC